MKSTDNTTFAVILTGIMRDVYEKPVSPTLINLWIASLKPYDLADVQAAFERHITDPDAGQFPPKPADLIRQLQALYPESDSSHPGPEEAWGMLNRLLQDEGETGVLTEEMRHAWAMCSPILQANDEVGARMCFLETYRKAVQKARSERRGPKWSLTMGTDVERRKTALEAAVDAGRISADYARSLLPAPVASLEQLAGLLEHDGPKPEPSQPRLSARFRELAAQLRRASVMDDSPAVSAEQARRTEMETRKAQIPVPVHVTRRAA